MLCNTCGNVLESFQRFCPKCGAPAQYQPPSASPGSAPYSSPQTPEGWGQVPPPRKSSCGKIILIVGIILLLLVLGAAAAIYYGYRYAESSLKSSEAYQAAVTALKKSPEVRDKLGEIIDTGFPLGAFSQNADGSGAAAFTMSVQASKGTGRYGVELVRSNSVWKVRNGNVQLPNGDSIQVGEDSTINIEDTPENKNTNLNTNTPENLPPGKTISGGVLNAKALSLPKPAYPPIAKQAHASGTVVVQVVVDEKGSVVSATAVSGHPLLRVPAAAAARQAKFSPTKRAGKPVRVSGVITYNFESE
jgi:TonB family protein